MRTAIAVLVLALSSNILADRIVLKGGQSARIDILDTSGCIVKIRRNGNIVKIPKDKITYIVSGLDTTSYENFACTPERSQQESNVVFDESYNPDKINAILARMPSVPSDLENRTIYCGREPIYGTEFSACWKDKFQIFKDELGSKYASVKSISNEELFVLLARGNDTNYVLIPFKTGFGYTHSGHFVGDIGQEDLEKRFGMYSGPGMMGARRSQSFLKAIVNIKIIDLKTRTIVFDDTSDYTQDTPDLVLFGDKKEALAKAKCDALENVLLNSINTTRRFISKFLGGH